MRSALKSSPGVGAPPDAAVRRLQATAARRPQTLPSHLLVARVQSSVDNGFKRSCTMRRPLPARATPSGGGHSGSNGFSNGDGSKDASRSSGSWAQRQKWDQDAIDVEASAAAPRPPKSDQKRNSASETDGAGPANEDDDAPWVRDISASVLGSNPMPPPPETPLPRAASVLRTLRPFSVLPYGVAIYMLLSAPAGKAILLGISAEEVLCYAAAFMLFDSATRMQRTFSRAAESLLRIPIEERIRDELLVGSAASNAVRTIEMYRKLRKVMLALIIVAPIELAAGVLAALAPTPAAGVALLQLAQVPLWAMCMWRLSTGGALMSRPEPQRNNSATSVAVAVAASAVSSASAAFGMPYLAGVSALVFAGVVVWQMAHERDLDELDEDEEEGGEAKKPPPEQDFRLKPIPIS